MVLGTGRREFVGGITKIIERSSEVGGVERLKDKIVQV